jgi:nitrogen-specific signal transduction histidine kinase
MGSGGTPGEMTAARSPRDLVFALCHELGNLLAGTRLEASQLDPGVGAAELVAAAERISEVSARAGSLLALVRPLLTPAAVVALPTDPLDVLDGLRRGLDESCDARVAIVLKSAAELPDVDLAPEMLHHLLLTAIFLGLEAGGPEGRVRVFAEVLRGRVAFLVEDEGPPVDLPEPPELRGRPLTHEVARTLLATLGGRLEISRHEDRTRVAFALPTARG